MRIRYGVAAALALIVVLALGSTGTSAAPAAATAAPENAVIYWSGVASNAIVVGRAPAASACSAAWFTERCTTRSLRSREASSRSQPV